MVEKILHNLYRIEIPLPNNPLQTLNSYVIKGSGSERSLVVDTGMNREECRIAMLTGLDEVGIDLDKTDFFITHMHADHCGLAAGLTKNPPVVYCSRLAAIDIERLSDREYWEKISAIGRLSGFPEEELQRVIYTHPGYKYCPRGQMNFKILKDKDTISAGGYNFICIKTPGHTTGHMCLYEPSKKILLSGDHILNDITPNISLGLSYNNNLLYEYINSLDKIYGLEVDLVLPGHRNLIIDCRGRIRELKNHFQARADEVLSILKKGSQDAYEVASQMTWDITCESWDLFPIMQKWFASGEAIAYLKYLEEMKMACKEEKEKKYYFALADHYQGTV